jgi:hypothetical protein
MAQEVAGRGTHGQDHRWPISAHNAVEVFEEGGI